MFPLQGKRKHVGLSIGYTLCGGGGGGGFFLACEDFGENVRPFIPRQRFFVVVVVVCLEVKTSSRTLIPLFMPGSVHSGSAS